MARERPGAERAVERRAAERRPRPAGRRAALALAAALALSGCASPGAGWLPGVGGEGSESAAIPTDRSASFDYLVARELEAQGKSEAALETYTRALSKDPDSVHLLKRVAQIAAREDRLKEALVYAERAHDLAPDDRGVRLFLGTLHRLRKDVAAAERVLRNEEGVPISTDAALLLYGIYADAKRLREAREVADWMLAHDPDALRGYFALADVLEKLGDPKAAEEVLRRGLAQRPGELSLYGALARSRRERGDRVGEIEIYREVLELHPDHHATLAALAEAQLALERRAEAVSTLRRIEREHPDDLRSVLRLAFLEYERGELAAAERRFERVLEAHPNRSEVAYFLGVTRRRMERLDGAIRALEQVEPEHERFGDARTQIAGIYEERGRFEKALAEVQRARERKPSRELDLYLASLRARSGDVEGALAFLKEMLEESPGDAEILYNIGVVHGEAERIDEAVRYMELVLGKDPDHAGALNYVGYTWAERGENLDRAEAMIARALEIRPNDGYITDSLGWVYYKRARPLLEQGRTEKAEALLDRALRHLERAHELTGGDPVVYEHLGDVHRARGEKERALEMYERALALDPRPDEQPDLRKKLEALREELAGR